MMQGFEQVQKMSKDSMDAAVKSMENSTKTWQAVASQMADYSKSAIEHNSGTVEKLMGVKTMDKAVEIQSAYAKQAYEGFVAHATKLGELYTAIAKDAMKPLENVTAAVAPKAAK